jgi:hypothetical protein
MRLNSRSQKALAITLPAWAILLTLTCLGLFSGYAEAQEKKSEDLDPNNFSNSTQIDNKWMPMKPGTRYVYQGTAIEVDGTAVPHRVVINVTDMTKVIGTVRSVVTWDLDYSANQLVEAELAFFTQDNDGTVLKTYKPMIMAQHTATGRTKASKITEDQAVKIALKAVPGVVTAVTIEKKLGANRYVVEVIAKADGVETDVIIDMETGKVLTTEK